MVYKVNSWFLSVLGTPLFPWSPSQELHTDTGTTYLPTFFKEVAILACLSMLAKLKGRKKREREDKQAKHFGTLKTNRSVSMWVFMEQNTVHFLWYKEWKYNFLYIYTYTYFYCAESHNRARTHITNKVIKWQDLWT